MSHPPIPVGNSDDHRHILTVAIEDYYQGATFNRLIPRARWHRFESRLARNTATTLDLLDEYKLKATFFALGWVADAVPELIREVVARGHDIASKGYFHRSIREFSRDEFRDDTVRAREALERASGRQIDGYRVAQRWLRPEELWALDVLAEEGYKFDSSIRPLFRQYVNEPWRRFVHKHHHGEHTMLEVPVSTTRVMGHDIPIAGANYFRQLPFSLVQRAVRAVGSQVRSAVRDVLPRLGARSRPAEDRRRALLREGAPVPQPRSHGDDAALLLRAVSLHEHRRPPRHRESPGVRGGARLGGGRSALRSRARDAQHPGGDRARRVRGAHADQHRDPVLQ